MTAQAHPLFNQINDIAPLLRKFAAHHSGTQYASTFDGLAPEAQDLYQHAVAEILKTCKPGNKKSYLLNLADWRMRNLNTSASIYAHRIITEADTQDDDTDGDSILELIVDESRDPESILIQQEAQTVFETLKASLKPEYAVIITLLSEGFQLPEIARKLGISYDAARKRLGKIRETFAQAGLTPAFALA